MLPSKEDHVLSQYTARYVLRKLEWRVTGSTGTFLSTHKVASENRDLISGETSTVVCLKFSKLKNFYFNCEFILILLLNASSLNDRFILLL